MANEGNIDLLFERLSLVLEQRQLRDAMAVLNDETRDGDLAADSTSTPSMLRVFRRHLNSSVLTTLALHDAGDDDDDDDDDQQILQELCRLAIHALFETIQFRCQQLEHRSSHTVDDIPALPTAAQLAAARLDVTYDIGDDETTQQQPYRDGGFGSVPACAAAVRSLEKETFCADGTCGCVTECGICFEEFADGGQVTVMPCPSRVHKFHPDCISKWLAISNVCPLCRSELPAFYE